MLLQKIARIERIGFFPMYLMDRAVASSLKKLLGRTSGAVVNVYHGIDLDMYVDKAPWQELCDAVQDMLIQNSSFAPKIQKGMIRECARLKKFSDQLLRCDPKQLSNRQLFVLYNAFEKRTLALRTYAWVPNLVDMGRRSIFSVVEEAMKKEIGPDPKIKEYISVLTTPTGVTQQRQHELDLYAIQERIQKKRMKRWENDSEINRLIEDHLRKYRWLAYYYIGPAWDRKDIVAILKNNLQLVRNLRKKIQEAGRYEKEIERKKVVLRKHLRLAKSTLLLLEKIATMIFLKAYRKEFLIYSNYCFEPVLREIGRRLDISLDEVRFMTKNEIGAYLQNTALLTKKVKALIRSRWSVGCISIAKGDSVKIVSPKDEKKYLLYIEKEQVVASKEIEGGCAYPGKVQGVARVINLKTEVHKIRNGEIMVSRSTNPDLIVAMRKAAALVTDEGGITCHAAIVAREMKKPCIVGTKIATGVFRDGDVVEVDAIKGIVRLLKEQ